MSFRPCLCSSADLVVNPRGWCRSSSRGSSRARLPRLERIQTDGVPQLADSETLLMSPMSSILPMPDIVERIILLICGSSISLDIIVIISC